MSGLRSGRAVHGAEKLSVDVVVVGSGAGGASAAYELVSAGLDVLVLDPHEGELSDVPALSPPGRDDDHRKARVQEGVRTLTIARLVLLDLLAYPVRGAGLVLTY